MIIEDNSVQGEYILFILLFVILLLVGLFQMLVLYGFQVFFFS